MDDTKAVGFKPLESVLPKKAVSQEEVAKVNQSLAETTSLSPFQAFRRLEGVQEEPSENLQSWLTTDRWWPANVWQKAHQGNPLWPWFLQVLPVSPRLERQKGKQPRSFPSTYLNLKPQTRPKVGIRASLPALAELSTVNKSQLLR